MRFGFCRWFVDGAGRRAALALCWWALVCPGTPAFLSEAPVAWGSSARCATDTKKCASASASLPPFSKQRYGNASSYRGSRGCASAPASPPPFSKLRYGNAHSYRGGADVAILMVSVPPLPTTNPALICDHEISARIYKKILYI